MSVLFTSDPHIGHVNIASFRSYVDSKEENNELFFDQWNKHVNKRTIVYLLGDVMFDRQHMSRFMALPGKKILVKGNHDNHKLKTADHFLMFDEIHGMLKYKKFWLTHAPIHMDELRECVNIHGHTHNHSIDDKRYINVCQDVLYPKTGSIFTTLEKLKKQRDENITNHIQHSERSLTKAK